MEPSQPPPAEPETFRYDHVVDGYHKHRISAIIMDFFENEHPLRLAMERRIALIYAESIRELIEREPQYREIAITRETIVEAVHIVLRLMTKTTHAPVQ